MSDELRVQVNQDSPRAVADGNFTAAKGTKRGELCVIDFYTQMALEGRGYQLRIGTVTTGVTGKASVITDAAAEGCVDCTAGLTIIPCEVWITYDTGVGDDQECAIKSVATVSSAGSAFVPLPLLIGGSAAASTARQDDEGGVTVTAEVDTTTLQHLHVSSEFAQALGTDSPPANPIIWQPIAPPVLPGPRCFYIQLAADTTAPDYFLHADYLELLTAQIS